ncbi:hypothetical protein AN958_11353 [Leucoagaricus sp. SymC.cos]|nr:hypothetical protein AN958_11353 [Leucoagaricus sp. SymC.cos]
MEETSRLLEESSGLPANHYGERPCRTTMDAIYHLIDKIKGAWRIGLVASVLYLDVEGAFPNTVTDRLIHNMCRRRVPPTYVEFVHSLLTNCRTCLKPSQNSIE